MQSSFLQKISIASPKSESLFYVKIENPEIKIGYLPKIKLAHRIYLHRGECSGKSIFKHYKYTVKYERVKFNPIA